MESNKNWFKSQWQSSGRLPHLNQTVMCLLGFWQTIRIFNHFKRLHISSSWNGTQNLDPQRNGKNALKSWTYCNCKSTKKDRDHMYAGTRCWETRLNSSCLKLKQSLTPFPLSPVRPLLDSSNIRPTCTLSSEFRTEEGLWLCQSQKFLHRLNGTSKPNNTSS